MNITATLNLQTKANKKAKTLKVLFTLFYALSTILNGYSSGIGSLSLGMIGYAIFCGLGILVFFGKGGKKQRICMSTIVVFLTLVILSLISLLFIDETCIDTRNMAYNFLKLAVWCLATSLLCVHLFDFITLEKSLVSIAVICTLYLFVQSLFYYIFHITLTNLFTFGFLKPNYDYYYSYGTDFTSSYRPASFFAEPAFYGYYVIIVLVFVLFGKQEQKHRILLSIFFTIGLLLSTSSTAIYLSGVIWLVFVAYRLKGFLRIIFVSILVFIIPFGFFLIYSFDWTAVFGNNAFGNIFSYAINKLKNIFVIERMGGSFERLSELTGIEKLFGVGVGNEFLFLSNGATSESFYLNSVTTLIFWSGLLGFSIFCIVLFWLFIKSNNAVSRFLLVLYFISGFYSGLYFSIQGILYLSIIIFLNHYYSTDRHKGYH